MTSFNSVLLDLNELMLRLVDEGVDNVSDSEIQAAVCIAELGIDLADWMGITNG